MSEEKHAFPWELTCSHGVPLQQDCAKCGFTTADLEPYADEANAAGWAAELGEPPEKPLEEIVRALQADMAFACRHTAVLVRSNNEALRMIVNTPRGQEIPKGVCAYTQDTTVEFQDIGMPQPNIPTMNMQQLVRAVHARALELGFELAV